MEQWQLNPECRLHWRCWDGECILFNAASGQTHLLNRVGSAALRLLEQGPHTELELQQQLARELDLMIDDEVCAYIKTMMVNMDDLGLIEPRIL